MKIKFFERKVEDSIYYPNMKVIDLGMVNFYRKTLDGHRTGHIKRYSYDSECHVTKELVINKYVL